MNVLQHFLIGRSLLSVAWSRSCLTLCFHLKKKKKKNAICLTFQRENEAVAHYRGVKSKEGFCMSL